MKKRIILSAVLTMVLCFCLIGGATFALFTSEANVNIAVSSGKVRLEANVKEWKAYSMGVEQTATDADGNVLFENGGTANYDEDARSLVLNRVAPGDKVELQIVVKNESNINIKYRLSWNVEGELKDALVVKANDEELENLGWTLWEANSAEKEITYNVVVELPMATNDDFQDKAYNVVLLVEGIQSNGLLKNYVTPATIDDALAQAQEGDEIELAAGFYDEIVVPVKGIKLFSNENAKVGFLNVNGKENITIQGLTFDASYAKGVVDASGTNGTRRSYANIAGATGKSTNIGARGLVIDNCKFTGEFANGGAAIAFADRNRPTGGSVNVTIKNCKFETTGAYYDIYGYYTGNPGYGFVIENNEFASVLQGKAIYLGRLKTSEVITVKGNSFKNIAAIEDAVYVQGDSSYTPSLDAADNTFNN